MIDIYNYKDWRIWKDPITRLQTAIKAVQEESDHRQLGATQIAICDHAIITLDCNYLEEEVTEHKNYLTAEDHVIAMGMRSREEWRERMEQISKELSNLTTTTTSNNIPYTDVDMNTLENKVNTLQELLRK